MFDFVLFHLIVNQCIVNGEIKTVIYFVLTWKFIFLLLFMHWQFFRKTFPKTFLKLVKSGSVPNKSKCDIYQFDIFPYSKCIQKVLGLWKRKTMEQKTTGKKGTERYEKTRNRSIRKTCSKMIRKNREQNNIRKLRTEQCGKIYNRRNLYSNEFYAA